jgi:DNA mismatch repair ATPase MutS
LAGRFFELTRDQSTGSWLDDKSWDDLEFPKLFSVLNTTVTPIGGQCLYKQLRMYVADPEVLRQRYQTSQTLRIDSGLRERLQLILQRLDADSTAYMTEILHGRLPAKPRHYGLIVAWAGVSVCSLIASFALSWTLWIPGVILIINALILFRSSPELDRDIDALLSCPRMLGVADRLAAVRAGSRIPQLSVLASQRDARHLLGRGTRWLATLDRLTRSPDPVSFGVSLAANLCVLAKFVAYGHAVDRFARTRQQWVSTFELIGTLDAAIAVANFMHRYPTHCRPIIDDESKIEIAEGYHPLLIRPVPISILLDRRSAVICGSNMAGKTAFVKMVGINLILGQTLGLCLASRATIPRSPAMASIRGEQSVESGKSRYFAEIDAVLGFIESASQGGCRVFLIDELFSGTNTIERVAAAKAVLDALSINAQVLVTTHDVELQHLLSDRFERYHFREDPSVEGFFDYQLRRGASHERNAIRLLERMGFPPQIIQEALALAEGQAASPRKPRSH